MNTKKKILMALALVGCAVLLVAGSIAGTLAYLTSQTETITNTFTVGNVAITMDETDVDVYGVKDGDTRVTANEYKLIPGHDYVKDPTIHVKKGSEACYLFVKVENGISVIEGGNTIAAQMTANSWKNITDTNVWYKETAIDARNATEDVDVAVFGTFTIDGNADLDGDPDGSVNYSSAQINITAYAVQADGFNDAVAAWDATFGASNGNS